MNKAIFLDRDGTINIEKNYLYKAQDFEYRDGVVECLKRLQDMGFILIVITNQSGIGRGLYSEEAFHMLTDWMETDLERMDIHISKTYYCPHYPDSKIKEYAKTCNCRKPHTGLFWQAKRDFQIDMERSFSIGDKLRDLEICKESPVKGILLTSDISVCDKLSTNMVNCKTFFEACAYIQSVEEGSVYEYHRG